MLKSWNTDKIIGLGLIIALLVKIIGDIFVTIFSGTSPPSDLPANIVSCLGGYMGRSLLEHYNFVDKDK